MSLDFTHKCDDCRQEPEHCLCSTHLTSVVDEAFESGRTQGFEEGKKIGHNEGYQEGLEKGKEVNA